jgi:hypothetical protein
MSRDSVCTSRGKWTSPTAAERRSLLRKARTIAMVGASADPARASNFVLTDLLSSSADYEFRRLDKLPDATQEACRV